MIRINRDCRALLVIGQSNAGVALGAALATALSGGRTVCHTRRGGQPLSYWVGDAPTFTPTAALITDLATMFAGRQFTDLDIVLFHGESDATAPLAPLHAAKVAAFIAYIKATVGATTLRCVFVLPWKVGAGGVAEGYLLGAPAVGAGDIIRANLVALAATDVRFSTVDSRLWERPYTEAGTVSSSGTTVTGVGTAFLTAALAAGHGITAAGQTRTLAAVPGSETTLTTTVAFSPALSGAAFVAGDNVHVTERGVIGDNHPYTAVSFPANFQSILTALAALP